MIIERGSAPPAQAQLTINVGSIQQAPAVITLPATNITSSGGTLNGSVNPNGSLTTVWFEFGTSSSSLDDSITLSTTAAGTVSANWQAGLAQLVASTTYYYRIVAKNTVGTNYSSIMSFTTPASPGSTVETLAATNITNSGATLNGSVIPNGLATTVWFQWGSTTALGASTTKVTFTSAGPSAFFKG